MIKSFQSDDLNKHKTKCMAIVCIDRLICISALFSKQIMGIGVEEEDKKSTWLEDAEWFTREGVYECARAIYGFTLNEFPQKKSIWLQAATFEKEHGTTEVR